MSTVSSPWRWLHQDGVLVLPLLVLLPVLVLLTLKRNKGASTTGHHRPLPPSPPKLPVIGNLHQVGHSPHRSLAALAQEHGPLMSLQLGRAFSFVVSSADMLEEIMKANGAALANRPETELIRQLSKHKDLVFSSYGDEYWKNLWRLYNHNLFGTAEVQSYKTIREEEVALVIEKIRRLSSSSDGVDLGKIFHDLIINFFFRAFHGRRPTDEGFDGMFHELMAEQIALISRFNIHDYFPFLRWLSRLVGFDAQVKRVSQEWDRLIECIIKSHLDRSTGSGDLNHQETIVDVLLAHLNNPSSGFPLTAENIKPIMIELVSAGTNSPAHTLEWAMAELIRSSKVMERAQAEVRSVAGAKPVIDEADIVQMDYLRAVVKETLRLHPPSALLLPRQSSDDTWAGGYEIPKQAWVVVNAWAIMRDPKYWEAPEEFRPERFLDANVDLRGTDFKFIPFSFGRRICPGLKLAESIIELALANLMHRFDWELPNEMQGEDLDMEEIFAVPMRRKHSLLLIPTPHSRTHFGMQQLVYVDQRNT